MQGDPASATMCEDLKKRLNSFDPARRKAALEELRDRVAEGAIPLPEPGTEVNLHCHSFFSYNCYGYSPSAFAWRARKAGLAVAGIVDFDVLDGLEEFHQAGAMLGLKTVVGIETRVFVPSFSEREINSPGEPGISYHMGVGIPRPVGQSGGADFLEELAVTAAGRNRDLIARVNEHLRPVTLDYDRDVLPLTPSGNATERHICLAYARRAVDIMGDGDDLAAFWSDRLGTNVSALDLPGGAALQNAIRAATMKWGGVGYVVPDGGSFPRMEDMNRFVLQAGGIPTCTWLDGTSSGERAIEEFLDVAMDTGVAALNIIPDRNFTPGGGDDDGKLSNLRRVVDVARQRGLPLVVGTEMNSPGQRFVDDFQSDELAPLLPIFLEGAHIVYAHTVLQRECGLGYTSEWASRRFDSTASRNEFFRRIGENLDPAEEKVVAGLDDGAWPEAIFDCVLTSGGHGKQYGDTARCGEGVNTGEM